MSAPWSQSSTHWSRLLEPATGEAWEYFYERYRNPVATLFRRKSVDPGQLDDLVQDFFVVTLQREFLEKADPGRGRFRGYLFTAANRFLVSHWRKQGRQKRHHEQSVVSLDEEHDLAAERDVTPEEAFDRAWAHSVLERSTARTREELEQKGKGDHFQAFTRRQEGEGWQTIAQNLGTTPGAARNWVHRVEKAVARFVRMEISDTVSGPEELERELRDLSLLLGRS